MALLYQHLLQVYWGKNIASTLLPAFDGSELNRNFSELCTELADFDQYLHTIAVKVLLMHDTITKP